VDQSSADRPILPCSGTSDNDEADPEFVNMNESLSDNCARLNIMRLIPVAFQTALPESMGTAVFPDGIPIMTADIKNAYIHSPMKESDDDVQFEFLGRCLCSRVGNPNSRCDNYKGPFFPPFGRYIGCSTVPFLSLGLLVPNATIATVFL